MKFICRYQKRNRRDSDLMGNLSGKNHEWGMIFVNVLCSGLFDHFYVKSSNSTIQVVFATNFLCRILKVDLVYLHFSIQKNSVSHSWSWFETMKQRLLWWSWRFLDRITWRWRNFKMWYTDNSSNNNNIYIDRYLLDFLLGSCKSYNKKSQQPQ